MKASAVYGIGFGINGREAALQATQRALDQLGAVRPAFAIALAAQELDLNEVLAGLLGLLGETPLWGFSTLCPLTGEGDQPRAVVVALVAGDDLQVRVQAEMNFAVDSAAAAEHLATTLRRGVFLPQLILMAADGLQGNLEPLCQTLSSLPVAAAGGLAGVDPAWGGAFCIARNQAAPGMLSVAALEGNFSTGVGLGQGWADLGLRACATSVRGVHLETLDGLPAAEQYARWFGYPAGAWSSAPLAEMARLYPLGIELSGVEDGSARLRVRSPLRMEGNGALRMSAPVPEGARLHLMTGDPAACLQAAQSAAEAALHALGEEAHPLLAVALIDAAWRMLFEAHPSQLAEALHSVLGETPLVGAYTWGQLYRPALDQPIALENGAIEVIVLGQA